MGPAVVAHGYIRIWNKEIMKRFKHTNDEIQEAIRKSKEKQEKLNMQNES